MSNSPKTFIVADDLREQRLLLKRLLSRTGHVVLEAENGEEVLSLLRESTQRIDCLLLDMQMPELDGQETLQSMKQLDIHMPVIGIGCSRRPRELPEWMDGYLQKPIDIFKFEQQVLEILTDSLWKK